MSLRIQENGKAEREPAVKTDVKEEGRYLYCIVEARERVSLGKIGIEGEEVYTLPHKDICAVVHNCLAQPYRSDDHELIEAWVINHQKVVDTAWERWGVVLPLSFDTIVKGETADSTEQNLKTWLEHEYQNLKMKMEKVRERAEYGVQVFWDLRLAAQDLTETSPEIKKLDEEIKTKPRGLAYMYRQKLENLVKKGLETKADECFKDFYFRIREHAHDVRVEKIKNTEPGWQMILNLSCLVHKDKCRELGEELESINQIKGFSVRFTGPWPPYSFVGSA